jgi:hypothetical protein
MVEYADLLKTGKKDLGGISPACYGFMYINSFRINRNGRYKMNGQQLISKGVGLTTAAVSVPGIFEIFNKVASQVENPDSLLFEVGIMSVILGAYGAYRLGEKITNSLIKNTAPLRNQGMEHGDNEGNRIFPPPH